MLGSKLREEARELADASGRREIVHEAADLIYFTTVALAREGVAFAEIEAELDRRDRVVNRRAGDAKGE
jgi:phosphoribosyl-ATP pyrophosphohydrolase